MPMLSTALPSYSGPYQVGAIDIEVSVGRRQVGKSVFKDTGKPAFELETVLFTLYYPTASTARSANPKHLWVPKPLALHAEGYARFAHINNWVTNNFFTFGLWMLAGSTDIPALVDVPLHSGEPGYSDSASTNDAAGSTGLGEKLKIIVFSHGMASSRTSYTAYCGELASRGYVVAAIEHRDGSGPGSIITSASGTERNVFHVTASQLSRDPPIDTAGLKEEQLAFRQAEVEETVKVLRRLDAGEGTKLLSENRRGEGTDLAGWKGHLSLNDMVMSGHSYGATLALRALKDAPSPSRPFTGGLILDPGKQSGPLNADIDVPIVVIHSNSWSKTHSIFHGRPHFDVVREVVEGVNKRGKAGWFMTSLGTTHPSVTDAPLIEPALLSWTTGSSIDVREGVGQYVKVSQEFMRFLMSGKREGVLAEDVMSRDYKHSAMHDKLHSVPESIGKYWQVHVAPDA